LSGYRSSRGSEDPRPPVYPFAGPLQTPGLRILLVFCEQESQLAAIGCMTPGRRVDEFSFVCRHFGYTERSQGRFIEPRRRHPFPALTFAATPQTP
jgi:hypothetical protein